MAITERARRDLYEHAEETWGKEAADTLMAHLPPVGWADVATKADLAVLEARLTSLETKLEGKIMGLEGKMEGLEGRLTGLIHEQAAKQTRVFFAMTLTAVIAVSGLPHVLGRIL